jgi:5-methyltetrahydropteroyltriglutamate--homocysteine methyltransferase
VHICLGYGHLVRNKPSGYAFLPQLAGSIAAQSRSRQRNRSRPRGAAGLSEDDPARRPRSWRQGSRDSETGGAARRGAALCPGQLVAAPDCGMKYPRAAFGKLKALAGAPHRPRELEG